MRDLPPLENSPARTLFLLAEKGLDDAEARAMVTNWPYYLVVNTARKATTLAEAAKASGQGINRTAEHMVEMEDAGLMEWNSASSELRLVIPSGQS